jgi:lysyl-tRNA synthetase class 2
VTPKRFPDRDPIAQVRAEAEQLEPGVEGLEPRRLAGRVLKRRDQGKLVFLDLVDRSGKIQLMCSAERSGEVDVHLGDIVGVTGMPTRSRRGEPSLQVDLIELLAPIRAPLPDTFHGLTDVEQRYRRRYLDLLMNEESRADFLLRSFARPFETHHNQLDQTLYLRIATELYLKRLIVGGLERVYEIGKDFRNEGVDFKHNPEFTMLEWYEAYADYRDTMVRMERLVAQVAAETLGDTRVQFRGHEIDLAIWQRVSLVEALDSHGLWSREEPELRARLHERGIDTQHDRTWAQLLDHALSHVVEPALVAPTILYDYPLELSPFARSSEQKGIVERFEFFVGGMELGNAFSEINDSLEQEARFGLQEAEGGGGNLEAEHGDPDYVEALSYGMPPTGGLGMGIDRLAMVLLGKDSIRDVILFPALRERQG